MPERPTGREYANHEERKERGIAHDILGANSFPGIRGGKGRDWRRGGLIIGPGESKSSGEKKWQPGFLLGGKSHR